MKTKQTLCIRGRGAASNPPGRFETVHMLLDAGSEGCSKTELFSDTSQTIIAKNDSPDIGFDRSINPYRGCEHGCIYCYARPTHEYLGFSAGLDFESKIVIKQGAPELLRKELAAGHWKPEVVALSGVTDPYQPIEKRLRLTRRCLQVLAEFRNPVSIITKSYLVTRDIDILEELASYKCLSVGISITTLNISLQRKLEPRASVPERRLAAIQELASRGIPVHLMLAPVIPGLTEFEIPAILAEAKAAGVTTAAYQLLRLPHGLVHLFEEWLEIHAPARKKRVLARLREIRSGQLTDHRFFYRMKGQGTYAEYVKFLFETSCKKLKLNRKEIRLSTKAFRKAAQLPLFELHSENEALAS